MSTRTEVVAAIETEIIRRLCMERPERAHDLVTVLAGTCPPPLPRWFADQRWRLLALALDAVARGDLAADPIAWIEHLGTIPQGMALDLIAGRPVKPWADLTPSPGESAADRLGGLSALMDLADQGLVCSFPDLANRLRHAGQEREAVEVMRESVRALGSTSLDDGPAAPLGIMMERLGALLADRRGGGCLGDSLHAALDHAEQEAQRRTAGHARQAGWGLTGLDDLVRLAPGRLIVLAASPGGGKTSLALQSTLATAETGKPGAVAYLSEEMPAAELALVLAARSLGINRRAIEERDPRITPTQWSNLRALADGWQARGTVAVRDAGTETRSTLSRAVAWIRQRQQVAAGNLALVIVDHLGLLESDNPRAMEYERVSDTTRALKRLAVQTQVPILALCQISRAGRKEIRDRQGRVTANPEPVLSDLRGSGSIEQDADAVVMLHREEVDPAAKVVPVTAYIRKNRGGPLGAVPLLFHPAHQVFEDDIPPLACG